MNLNKRKKVLVFTGIAGLIAGFVIISGCKTTGHYSSGDHKEASAEAGVSTCSKGFCGV